MRTSLVTSFAIAAASLAVTVMNTAPTSAKDAVTKPVGFQNVKIIGVDRAKALKDSKKQTSSSKPRRIRKLRRHKMQTSVTTGTNTSADAPEFNFSHVEFNFKRK